MTEKKLHLSICQYLDAQYPNVIYTTDASGLRLSMGLRMEMKRKRCKRYKIPDLLILQPSNGYSGLFIEIKTSLDEVFKKNGELREDEHTIAQTKTINRLNEIGYKAIFGCGFEHCKDIIDNYFK